MGGKEEEREREGGEGTPPLLKTDRRHWSSMLVKIIQSLSLPIHVCLDLIKSCIWNTFVANTANAGHIRPVSF